MSKKDIVKMIREGECARFCVNPSFDVVAGSGSIPK